FDVDHAANRHVTGKAGIGSRLDADVLKEGAAGILAVDDVGGEGGVVGGIDNRKVRLVDVVDVVAPAAFADLVVDDAAALGINPGIGIGEGDFAGDGAAVAHRQG